MRKKVPGSISKIVVHSFAAVLLCVALFVVKCEGQSQATGAEPLQFLQSFDLPSATTGNFDHFEVDLKRHRLFVTAEDAKSVFVLNLETSKVVHTIKGVERPHAVLYRPEIDHLFVTDGGDGSVKIFDGEDYRQIARVSLTKDADSIGYDISRRYLYIDNGGKDAGRHYSLLSAVDTANGAKLGDVRVESETLEAMALDSYRPRTYVNDKAMNQVIVIDRFANKMIAKWPLTMCKENVAMALDEQRQRLFVGCRSGQIVVLDSNTGKELQALAIGKGVDDVIYDSMTGRIYAAANGAIDVFEQTDLNHYVSRGSVVSGANGRTAKLVPELNRLFVAVPASAGQSARIMVYEPVHTPTPRTAPAGDKEPVNAPIAQRIVLETLSAHPLLRRMGLHVIPPGQKTMILIANGNATRLGIHTSESDFAAVKSGKMYGPRIADGEFYNMKMPMFDAQGRRIGILVMEIACTDATSEEDAARKAESIRSEVEQKIPSLESLFAATVRQ